MISIYRQPKLIHHLINQNKMEERSTRRTLRNNSHCVPVENIFKNNDYIMNSASQCVPPQILTKIRKFQTLTCDDINSLTFFNNESHSNALDRMNEVIELQKNVIHNKHQPISSHVQEAKKFSYNAMEQKEPHMIKSEQHENEYKLQFLEKYDRPVYQKHNHYQQYGEEILYNQFFRSDLENLFLQ